MPERSRHPFRLIADTKVGTRLLILVLGFLIWGAVGSLLAFQTLREVQVNGPIYARLVEGKDLIADILPPPRYIVEANLLAHELFLADAAEDKSDLEQRLRSLAQDYARRQSFWEQAGLEAPLHQALVVKSHEPANLFFKVAFDAFLPALRAGDRDAAAKHLAVMNRDYKEHRKAILDVVRLAEARNQQAEAYATATLHRRIVLWVGVAAGMSILVIGFSLVVRRSIVDPLDDAVETVQSIAGGDLTHPVPKGHTDEIGKLLDAVGTMQDSLRTLVGSVQRDAAFLAQASQEMSTAAGESASATTAQSEAVADMAASMEQMSVSIDQVEENARTAKATAARSGEQSRQGGEVI